MNRILKSSTLCAYVAVTLLGLSGITACGIKPGSLTPPSGQENNFPSKYPKDNN